MEKFVRNISKWKSLILALVLGIYSLKNGIIQPLAFWFLIVIACLYYLIILLSQLFPNYKSFLVGDTSPEA
ncbi:hypothetical protein A2W24_04175 [Microgenomates group bacterium RBG_16_45_19]|nr:MAG: hypothetical protein A2W24_04175 [Microgenomates group bacterium RBG_16_45_19]